MGLTVKNTQKGYMFQAKRSGNMFGVKEEFDVKYRGGIGTAQIIIGVDQNGAPVSPAIFKENSFLSLRGYIEASQDMEGTFERYLRSKKPTYALNTNVFLLCVASISFDTQTGVIVRDSTKVSFFMVDKYGDTSDYGFVVFGKKLSSVQGVNSVCVAQGIIDGFTRNLLSTAVTFLGDRRQFIENRLYQ